MLSDCPVTEAVGLALPEAFSSLLTTSPLCCSGDAAVTESRPRGVVWLPCTDASEYSPVRTADEGAISRWVWSFCGPEIVATVAASVASLGPGEGTPGGDCADASEYSPVRTADEGAISGWVWSFCGPEIVAIVAASVASLGPGEGPPARGDCAAASEDKLTDTLFAAKRLSMVDPESIGVNLPELTITDWLANVAAGMLPEALLAMNQEQNNLRKETLWW